MALERGLSRGGIEIYIYIDREEKYCGFDKLYLLSR